MKPTTQGPQEPKKVRGPQQAAGQGDALWKDLAGRTLFPKYWKLFRDEARENKQF